MSIYRILTAITKEQVQTQLQKRLKDKPELIEQVLQADPTPNKGYSIWISKLALAGTVILPEDIDKLQEKITQFEELKKRGKIKGVDINQVKSYGELARIVEKAMGEKTKGETYRDNLVNGQQQLWTDGFWAVYRVTTPEACAKLFRGTEWCVKDHKHSEYYLADGPLTYVTKQGQPYALLHEANGDAKNVYDETIDEGIAEDLASFWDKLGIDEFNGELELILNYIPNEAIMADLDKNYYIAYMERGLISFDQFAELEKKHKGITPRLVGEVRRLFHTTQKPMPQHEDIILSDASVAYEYAAEVMGGPWPKGEPVIARDSYASYSYASNVLEGRFPAGEPTIIQDGLYRRRYTIDVVKGRWPEAEAAMLEGAKDEGGWNYVSPSELAYYAITAINGRWPEAEKYIATYGPASIDYAIKVLKSRFPAGEPAILERGKGSEIYLYITHAIKGQWPEAEPILRRSENLSYWRNYLDFIKHLAYADTTASTEAAAKLFAQANKISLDEVEVAELSDRLIISSGEKMRIVKKSQHKWKTHETPGQIPGYAPGVLPNPYMDKPKGLPESYNEKYYAIAGPLQVRLEAALIPAAKSRSDANEIRSAIDWAVTRVRSHASGRFEGFPIRSAIISELEEYFAAEPQLDDDELSAGVAEKLLGQLSDLHNK